MLTTLSAMPVVTTLQTNLVTFISNVGKYCELQWQCKNLVQ
jgi:hypothetical protein